MSAFLSVSPAQGVPCNYCDGVACQVTTEPALCKGFEIVDAICGVCLDLQAAEHDNCEPEDGCPVCIKAARDAEAKRYCDQQFAYYSSDEFTSLIDLKEN